MLISKQPKKKPAEAPAVQRAAAPQLRIPQKPGVQAADDLQLLEDIQAEKENEILRDIKANIAKHIKWNEGYVDLTSAPLSPSPERTLESPFRPAITAQLPTPPSSDSSEINLMHTTLDIHAPSLQDKLAPHPMDIMDVDEDTRRMPSFRRRIGRGGRLMIDRRNLSLRFRTDMDPRQADRFKYDQEDSDDDPVYERDKYDIQIMQHRAVMAAKARDQAAAAHALAQRRFQAEQNSLNNGASISGSAAVESTSNSGATAAVSES